MSYRFCFILFYCSKPSGIVWIHIFYCTCIELQRFSSRR